MAAATLSPPLHRRPVPAGQGDRPGRRGVRAACASRSTRCPRRSTTSAASITQLEIEREGLKKETDPHSRERPRRDRARARRAERAVQRGSRPTGRRRRRPSRKLRARQGEDREGPERPGRGRAPGRPEPRRGAQVRRPPRRWRRSWRQQNEQARRAAEEAAASSRRRWTPRTSPRWSPSGRGIPVSRLLEGEVQKLVHMEERLAQRVIGQRPRDRGGVQRRPPRPQRAAGPQPAHRLVHLPGPHRRGEDGDRQGAGRVPLRRRAAR